MSGHIGVQSQVTKWMCGTTDDMISSNLDKCVVWLVHKDVQTAVTQDNVPHCRAVCQAKCRWPVTACGWSLIVVCDRSLVLILIDSWTFSCKQNVSNYFLQMSTIISVMTAKFSLLYIVIRIIIRHRLQLWHFYNKLRTLLFCKNFQTLMHLMYLSWQKVQFN